MSSRENISLSILTFLALCFLAEVISFALLHTSIAPLVVGHDNKDITQNLYPGEPHPQLGWSLKKNSITKALFIKNNTGLGYKATYRTDQYRRRFVENTEAYDKKKQYLLLFGDSTIFGIGLNDKETLHYQLQKKLSKYQVYNYAVYGYGPHQTLKHLEILDPSEVSQKKGVAILSFLPGHFFRVTGSSRVAWNESSPKYELENGLLQFKGSLKKAQPWKTLFYKIYSKLKAKSNLLFLINLDFPLRIKDKDIKRMSAIIVKCRDIYESKFNGKFFFNIHPLYNNNSQEIKDLKEHLVRANINIIEYPEIKVEEKFFIPFDKHPNAQFNKIFSEKLAESLTPGF